MSRALPFLAGPPGTVVLVLLRTFSAFVAGIVLALAFEPVAIAYLIPLALAAFALTTRGLRARRAWIPGLLFGVGFYFVHIYWMRGSIGTGAWIALSALEAAFYGLLGALAAPLQRLRFWPLWMAAAWTTMEIWRSGWPFSGMPWGRLAYGVIDSPVAAALAYVGVNGVSFLLALLGFLLAGVVLQRELRGRLVAGGVLTAVALLGALPAFASYELDRTGEATVAAVQGDVPGRGNDILFDPQGVTDNHVQATIALAADVRSGAVPQPDFVVWPENSTAVDPFRNAYTNQAIRSAASAVGVPIMVGAIVDAGEENVLNQGIVWDPVTGAGDRYTKKHPVPYGEYIPVRDLMPESLTTTGQLARVPRDMLSGTRVEPLRVAGIELADSICFDIAYDDGIYAQVERGAQMLTVQTSNASFIFTDQIDQQFAITRVRAIETGRAVVVAATNGISGVIAPDGSVVASTEALTRDVLVETVPLVAGVTPGVRLGGWLGVLLPVLTAAGLALRVLAYRRQDPTAAEVEAPEPALTGDASDEAAT